MPRDIPDLSGTAISDLDFIGIKSALDCLSKALQHKITDMDFLYYVGTSKPIRELTNSV